MLPDHRGSRMTSSYSIRFDHRPFYLVAQVEGPEDTLAISLAYWAEIAVECRRHHVSRLLVIEKLETPSNLEDASMVIAELNRMGFGDIRIAFVDPTESIDLMVHAEIEGRRTGLEAHVFGNEALAVQWLLSDITNNVAIRGSAA